MTVAKPSTVAEYNGPDSTDGGYGGTKMAGKLSMVSLVLEQLSMVTLVLEQGVRVGKLRPEAGCDGREAWY